MANQHDLVVIGAGPGGYVAAIRAAQLGLDVACIEREAALGGTCLRIGCIPSKAMLESSQRFHEAEHALARHGVKVGGVELDLPAMMARKDKTVKALTGGVNLLFRKNKITRYQGTGRITGPGKVVVSANGNSQGGGETEINAGHILIATGSVPAPLRGVAFDGDRIGTSTEALSYPEVPRHLVVIGAGAIGLELGSVWRRLGAETTVLEYLDRILPGMDLEVAREAQKLLEKQGITFHLKSRVTGARVVAGERAAAAVGRDGSRKNEGGPKGASEDRDRASGGPCVVEAEGMAAIDCDRVLVSVGRAPFTEGLGLDAVGITPDPKGRIPVNEHFETSAEGVYAIGDVIAGPMLAHKAEEEGIACVERIVTGYGHVNYQAIPNIVYTHPEVASVGRSEEDLTERGIPYRKGSFPFRGNGRARALEETDGFVKLLAHAETDRLLGAHIVGARAGDLIAELAVAIEFGASAEDVARSCHAHPTLSEVVREAALAVAGRALHN